MRPERLPRYAIAVASLGVLGLLALCAVAASYQDLLEGFGETTLAIATPDARVHRLHVWVAESPRQRAQGLMWIEDLPPDDGMIFVYGRAQRISMWMKNTVMPLDMLFVADDGRIAQIVADTKPYSLDTISSDSDCVAVIELRAGTAARLGIRAGALVLHPYFGTAPRE